MKRIVGIAMQVFAVVFWLQFVAIQLYDPMSEGFGALVWTIFDPFVAAGTLITIYVGLRRKQDVDKAQDGGLTKEYFEANLTGLIRLTAQDFGDANETLTLRGSCFLKILMYC